MNSAELAMTEALASLLDIDRYPIHDLASPRAQALIASCRDRLASRAAACLPGFIRREVLAAMASEVAPLVASAFRHTCEHNVYFVDDDPAFPPDHPRRFPQYSAKHNIAADLIAGDALIRRVYEYRPLREFVAAIVGEQALYLQADPLSSLNVMSYGPGDQFGWHYDRTPYSVTILLQDPDAGGVFQYVPYLRAQRSASYGKDVNEQEVGGAEEEGWGRLENILRGSTEGVLDLDFSAGAMSILFGRHSLHRVTPVRGKRARVMAILAYEPKPGVMFNDETRIRFYGRAR